MRGVGDLEDSCRRTTDAASAAAVERVRGGKGLLLVEQVERQRLNLGAPDAC